MIHGISTCKTFDLYDENAGPASIFNVFEELEFFRECRYAFSGKWVFSR
jgi:hypothetical protein